MKGISIKPTIGVGDGLQFSSVPENYFRATGEKLYDVSRPWFFDYNPYICRDYDVHPESVREMWNFSPKQYDWPKIRDQGVYLSNAEISAAVWNVPVALNRPRLYRYEDYPYEDRRTILLHVDGISHGTMPQHVIDHVIKKYSGTRMLFQVGVKPIDLGIPRLETKTLWELASLISQCRMFIGVDSGPSWIAACFPDVIVKKLRTKPTPEHFKTWVPLSSDNIHSFWDDRVHQIFNPTDDDIGFTGSYKRI